MREARGVGIQPARVCEEGEKQRGALPRAHVVGAAEPQQHLRRRTGGWRWTARWRAAQRRREEGGGKR